MHVYVFLCAHVWGWGIHVCTYIQKLEINIRYCHSLFSMAVMKAPWPRQLGMERVNLAYPWRSPSAVEASQHRNSGREPGGRAGAETLERHGLLACSHGSLSLLPWTTQSCLPTGSTTHSGLSLHTSIINQENGHKLSFRPVWWRPFLSWGSFSQIAPAWDNELDQWVVQGPLGRAQMFLSQG